ncbi:MAG: CRISPR-associated endonuclease Cas2 [Planctomycetaceae bacterium]|nr:CRISPR-associated endonuclease Cas2 [Planctomycetaceae bacterium]
MRGVYLICYDVADPKRLRKTYRTLQGAGDALQYSVFRCELSRVELQGLKESLWDILNFEQDRVMLVNLGPAGARGDDCIEHWGEPRTLVPDRSAVIF